MHGCQLPIVSAQWQTGAVVSPDNPQATARSRIKVAVLGTGSLGKEHTRIYAELAAAGLVEFAGAYDLAAETARKIADQYRVRSFGSVTEAAVERETYRIV